MARRLIRQLSCLSPVVPLVVHPQGINTPHERVASSQQRRQKSCASAGFHDKSARCQEAPRPPRVAVVGDVFVDIMARVQSLPEWDIDVEADFVKVLPGGSALNGARHLHSLGAEVRFFGAVGDDGFGKMLLAHVAAQGFPTNHLRILPDLPSSVCMVLTGPKDRAMVSCYSSTSAFSSSDLEDQASVLLTCEHLHIGGYYNMKGLQSPEFIALVRRCREHGMSISMNTQYAASEDWLGKDGNMLQLLPLVDFLFVSSIEAEGISKAVAAQYCSSRETRQVSARGPGNVQQLCNTFPGLTAVVTRGPQGCDLVSAGSSIVRVPTAPLSEVVDATGAGDAFVAGFLCSWLSQKSSSDGKNTRLQAACKMGHAVARVVVCREGACVEPVRLGDINVGLHCE